MELNSRTQECFSVSLAPQSPYLFGMKWYDRLVSATRRKGWSHVELARRSDADKESIHKYFQGKVEQPRGDTIERLAEALGISALWLRYGVGPELAAVPIVGYVGAGEMFIPVPDNHLGDVALDMDVPDPIAAVVRGISNTPVYRPGDTLICSRHPATAADQYLNHDCVLLTTEGLGYVKKVVRGQTPNRVTLLSYNANPIENVELQWAAPIRWIKRA